MRSLGSERLHRRIEEVLTRRDAARNIGWRLLIGGEDFTRRVKDGGYTTEDGPAIALDIDVAGVVSESLEGEEAVLEWIVDNIPVPAFTGTVTDVIGGALISTVQGATPGEAIERTELGDYLAYGGANPSTVIHDALSRVTGYQQGLVRISPIQRPKFRRQDSDAYSATDFVGDIVEAVQEENPRLVYYDSADGGCDVFIEPNLAHMPEPVWTFEVGVNIKREDFEDGREDDKYRHVIVRRAVVAPVAGTDPWVVLARVEVEGSRAPVGTVLRIDVTDDDLEGAFAQAHEAAQAQAYRIGRISWIATYVHPLLERGDVVAVINPGKDALGPYRERWLCVLDRASCSEVRRKRGIYEGEARVMETIRVRKTPTPLRSLSPGVVPKSVVGV